MGKIVSLELGYFSEISCVAVGGAESWIPVLSDPADVGNQYHFKILMKLLTF